MNKKILLSFILLLSLHHSFGWCRSSKSSIEARLDSIENKLESNLSFELASKIDDLQREVQDLRGILEEKHHHAKADLVGNVEKKLDPEHVAYNSAHKLVEDKNFQEAIVAFKDFLSNYGNSHYVPNAIYWLGELYLTDHNFEVASNYFSEVVNKYKEHSKAPDALLKLGILELERENWQGAREYFNQIKNNYSNSSRVLMAEAKLQSMERDGH